jgi:hypothetical protein
MGNQVFGHRACVVRYKNTIIAFRPCKDCQVIRRQGPIVFVAHTNRIDLQFMPRVVSLRVTIKQPTKILIVQKSERHVSLCRCVVPGLNSLTELDQRRTTWRIELLKRFAICLDQF